MERQQNKYHQPSSSSGDGPVFEERMLEIQRQMVEETMTYQQRMVDFMFQMNRIALSRRRHHQLSSVSASVPTTTVTGTSSIPVNAATDNGGNNQEIMPDGYHQSKPLLNTTSEMTWEAVSEAAAATAQELPQQEGVILTIYLRDYYSQYHNPKNATKNLHFNSSDRFDLKKILRYWTDVETLSRTSSTDTITSTGGRALGMSTQCCRHSQPVGYQLSWPRTVIDLNEDSLSSDGALVDLQPYYYSLAMFQGEMLIPTSCPDEVFYRVMNVTSSQYLNIYARGAIFSGQPSITTDTSFGYFTNLKSLKVADYCQVTDEAFRHLRSLLSLELVNAFAPSPITDEAFRHLKNLQSLVITDSPNAPIRITEKAFCHLTNLRSLNFTLATLMSNEAFRTLENLTSLNIELGSRITDEAFRHLPQLRSLSLRPKLFSGPMPMLVTDEAFKYLINLRSLEIGNCSQMTISSEAFRHLTNLKLLNMTNCHQTTIDDACFRHLTNLTFLKMNFCKQTTISDEGLRHLTNLISFGMMNCDQQTITNETFCHLKNLKFLDILGCSQITDEAFVHLRDLHSLVMGRLSMNYPSGWEHPPPPITDEAFRHFSNLKHLTMIKCNQTTITDEAFRHLTSLRSLSVDGCDQATITKKALHHLTRLHSLEVDNHDQTNELFCLVNKSVDQV